MDLNPRPIRRPGVTEITIAAVVPPTEVVTDDGNADNVKSGGGPAEVDPPPPHPTPPSRTHAAVTARATNCDGVVTGVLVPLFSFYDDFGLSWDVDRSPRVDNESGGRPEYRQRFLESLHRLSAFWPQTDATHSGGQSAPRDRDRGPV